MLKYSWKELGRPESIFLEILDDPTKKEVLLYPICYCQLVRKFGSFNIDLDRLISCASKTFRVSKGRWQDILLELDLFQVITPEGSVLTGKDLLRLGSSEDLRVSFLPEYREIFYEIYSRFLKYWTVLSKVSSYTRKNTAGEHLYLISIIFNEELFPESMHYAEIQKIRYREEGRIFEALELLSTFYDTFLTKRESDRELLLRSAELLGELPPVYYNLNVARLLGDVEELLRHVSRGREPYVIKIGFRRGSGSSGGLIRRLISRVMEGVKKLGGRRWTLMSSETAYFSFIETCSARQKAPLTHS